MKLSFSINDFHKLFPDAESDKGGDAIKYKVEDSEYRIYNPSWSDNKPVLNIKLDHIRGGATDDHANLQITYNENGAITSIEGDYKAGNDGYQIPKIVITAVDASAEFLGAVGALETVGISEAVAEGVIAAFDAFCEVFNKLSSIISKLSDNGGRFYFTAVVAHAVNRANTCITVK